MNHVLISPSKIQPVEGDYDNCNAASQHLESGMSDDIVPHPRTTTSVGSARLLRMFRGSGG
jgi:hypothetical protein